jgi:carbonic anhydrase/acetyltransferase-like protein (isoleucine patch superfamily)
VSEPEPPAAPILRSFGERSPRIDPRAWIAPGAVVVGDVEIGADASVWYGTVLRGDVNHIRVGARTNIQDHCTIHVTTDRFPTWIAEEVTVGHRAVVHGCRIEAGALIGIGAIVLDGAVVEADALVGAGAVVTPGSVVPSGMLAMGVPARPVRALSDEEIRLQRARTLTYVETARRHAASGPLPRARRSGSGGEAAPVEQQRTKSAPGS